MVGLPWMQKRFKRSRNRRVWVKSSTINPQLSPIDRQPPTLNLFTGLTRWDLVNLTRHSMVSKPAKSFDRFDPVGSGQFGAGGGGMAQYGRGCYFAREAQVHPEFLNLNLNPSKILPQVGLWSIQ